MPKKRKQTRKSKKKPAGAPTTGAVPDVMTLAATGSTGITATANIQLDSVTVVGSATAAATFANPVRWDAPDARWDQTTWSAGDPPIIRDTPTFREIRTGDTLSPVINESATLTPEERGAVADLSAKLDAALGKINELTAEIEKVQEVKRRLDEEAAKPKPDRRRVREFAVTTIVALTAAEKLYDLAIKVEPKLRDAIKLVLELFT